MDESTPSFSNDYTYQESPKIYIPRPPNTSSSGLTLVLPSLKSLKASQAALKAKNYTPTRSLSIQQDVEIQERRQPRPQKLKPLKEVLVKLIAQIKKKDDYAFFLSPVDVANVPGYSDIVKTPMDFGTMSEKVHRGKYRSLDDFATDFRLVTSNAKMFNPPGSIYYTEAEKIEAWGIEHINKAAAIVIQYETDWNIDGDRDDEGSTVNIDDEGEEPSAVTGEPKAGERERSVSVISQPQPISGRRGPRGPYRKHGQATNGATMSDTLEAEGGLPGAKDGVGAFPAGSEWAKTMIALKLKGKRYKTKKERLRIEREGPPLLPDGSLDYSALEDPFSVLSALIPDPPSRPHLIPLYPPLEQLPPASTVPPTPSDVASSSQIPQPLQASLSGQSVPWCPQTYLSPTAVSLSYNPPEQLLNPITNKGKPISRRRHWTITRNSTTRKGKEREEETDPPEVPAWQTPREPHALDFGAFSLLAAELALQIAKSNPLPTNGAPVSEAHSPTEQDATLDAIRTSLHCVGPLKTADDISGSAAIATATPFSSISLASSYWTSQRSAEAEEYLRDVVYGGVDGLAYVTSLARFLSYTPSNKVHPSAIIPSSQPNFKADQEADSRLLHVPVAQWVETNIVDPLTGGRHALLRETALALQRVHSKQMDRDTPSHEPVLAQVLASLHTYPAALVALSSLLHIRLQKIDMASLIRTPEELFLSEEAWAGKRIKERKQAAVGGNSAVQDPNAMEVDGKAASASTYELEGPEELGEVLEYVAEIICSLDGKRREGCDGARVDPIKSEDAAMAVSSPEDPAMRNLRLNLLALAKRAPLDTIARLPKDLVPEHIRHFIPTLGSGP